MRIVTDRDELEFIADEQGDLGTTSRVEDSLFRVIWTAVRRDNTLVVSFDGRSATFPLKGAGQVLDKEVCETDFARPE